VEQQVQRIYDNMTLLAFDLLACILSMRISASPPFSTLFTHWLSIMAAVGLASLSARHIKRVMDAIQRAVVGPIVEIVEQRAALSMMTLAKSAGLAAPLGSRSQGLPAGAQRAFPRPFVGASGSSRTGRRGAYAGRTPRRKRADHRDFRPGARTKLRRKSSSLSSAD
jgi:hypothetical protein